MLVDEGVERPPARPTGACKRTRRFCLDGGLVPDAPLSVVGGGHEYCPPSCVVDRPARPHFSIEFVARGRGTLVLGERRVALGSGTVFSQGPGVAHRLTTDARDPMETYFVGLTGPRAPQLLAERGLAPGTAARVSGVGEVRDVFDNLVRDGLRGTVASATLCAALADYLTIKLAEQLVPLDVLPSPASATFHRCRQHILTHFRRLRSLEQIAGECDINQAYLCRLFRRFDREGPYRYLLRLKMTFAAERLQDPKVLVKEAAAAVGFRDPFQFSHAFKNVFGTSPDVFRRSGHRA